MKFRYEEDPTQAGETKVAYEVTFAEDAEDDSDATCIELNKLSADQLWRLCKNVGVQYAHCSTKFGCRKSLWVNANLLNEKEEKEGARMSTAIERATSNTLRLVNVIFSSSFYENFLKLNDGMPRDSWGNTTEALNGDSEDDPTSKGLGPPSVVEKFIFLLNWANIRSIPLIIRWIRS